MSLRRFHSPVACMLLGTIASFASRPGAGVAAMPPAAGPSPFKGDVDGDHRLDVVDLHVLRAALDGVAPLTPEQATRADVNGDGAVDEADFSALTFPALDATSIPPFGAVLPGTPVIHAVEPSFAPPGAVVSLTGTGFAQGVAANEVRVGDVAVEVVQATPERIAFVAPPSTGVVSVTNLKTGRRGLSASFVVAGSDQPTFDETLPEGSVLLATPDEVLEANSAFRVPLAFVPGATPPSVFHVRLEFDPEHVEVMWVEPMAADWLAPLPPCIDNAAGVLGAGAMRLKSVQLSGVSLESPFAVFAIGFRVRTYRPHAPVVVARVERLAAGDDAATVGAATPRFGSDTAQLHPVPVAPPHVQEWPGSVADLPALATVTPAVAHKGATVVVSGQNLGSSAGVGGCVAFVGDKIAVPAAKTATSFEVKVNGAMRSGPLFLVDQVNARVSNPLLLVVPESEPPEVIGREPAPGATFVSSRAAVRFAFGEAMDGDALTFHRSVRLLVSAPGLPEREWPAAASAHTTSTTTHRLRPLLPFPALATVRVEIDPALADLSGNAIAPQLGWEFLVAP